MKTTKTLIFLVAAIIISTLSYSQTTKQAIDYLNVPGPILFKNKSYNLVWASHPADNFYKQEYIAKGDTITKFNTMILLDCITGPANIKDVVAAKVAELKKLKETNPVVNYEAFDNAKIGEYMLDFLLSADTPDRKGISVVERNVYRYKTFTDQVGQKGVLLLGISTRSYGDNVNKFLTDLKTNRKDLINEVAQYKMPEVSIKK
jgi:hypothetical protein